MEQEIIQASKKYIDTWNAENKPKVDYIDHKFSLKGLTAGMFCPCKNGSYFHWNLIIARENHDDYLIQTVGHEVAHWIVYNMDSKAKSHGSLWKDVMATLGLQPKRCHNYEAKRAKITKRPWKYVCPCGVKMSFTNQKYKNMILRGLKPGGETHYRCKTCHTWINIVDLKPVC